MDLSQKNVCILGAARSGLAAAKLVLRSGGTVRVSDAGSIGNTDWLRNQSIDFEENGHHKEFITRSDFIIVSPAIRRDAPPLAWAKAVNIPVITEIEFAFQYCSSPVIAVSGSNGKTTVCTLLNEVLKASGKTSALCGNIGWPFSRVMLEQGDVDYVVLEVSSFQLEALVSQDAPWEEFKRFKPFLALITNFSENHLDRHKDLQEYFEAKKNIFKNQDQTDFALLNAYDELSRDFAKGIASSVVYFHTADQQAAHPGMNANELAVLGAAEKLGISADCCRKVFKDFSGVEHRMELVGKKQSVRLINDSKSTTALATKYGLETLQGRGVLICGGRDKNLDFSVITPLVKEKIIGMIAIGEAKEKIAQIFSAVTEVRQAENLETALAEAMKLTKERQGSFVLFSPMCASFDMFKDFEERGRAFKSIVKQDIIQKAKADISHA